MDLARVSYRSKLAPSREPYWQPIGNGRAIGYRVGDRGGTWRARAAKPGNLGYRFQTLGSFVHLPQNAQYPAALNAALAWFEDLKNGHRPTNYTLRDALREYAKQGPADAASRFELYAYGDPIVDTPLNQLDDSMVGAMRERIASRPAKVARLADGTVKTRTRAASTINRDLTPVRAALNFAYKKGWVSSSSSWHHSLSPVASTRSPRRFVPSTVRTALIENAPDEFRVFLGLQCALPIRPGAVASMLVRDIQLGSQELWVRSDKANAGRQIFLPADVHELLTTLAAEREASEHLFLQPNGEPMNKDYWKWMMKRSSRNAALADAVTLYDIRHSVITDLVVRGVDTLTVARLAGTSLLMIERHYGHLTSTVAVSAISGLANESGFVRLCRKDPE